MNVTVTTFIWLASGTLLACDGGSDVSVAGDEPAMTESALTCSDEPDLVAPHLAMMAGCPFENHVYKIHKYGRTLDQTAWSVVDAAGNRIAVSGACDRFWLGVDTSGVQVIVDGQTGAVSYHGMVHPGAAISSLPATLPLPLELEAQ